MAGSETAPLVSRSDSKLSKKACDLLLVLPLLAKNDSDVDADDLLQGLTILDVHSKTFKSSELMTQVQCVSDACNGKDKIKLKEARDAFLQDLLNNLPKKGFAIRMFKSVDEDELFVRIILEDPKMEKHYAEQYRVRLQTTMDVMEKAGILQDPALGPVSPPYLDFDPEVTEQLQDEFGIEIYRKYYAARAEGSIFRGVDRIRLIQEILGRTFSLDRAVSMGVIKCHAPCHFKEVIHDLRKTWANFTCRRLFDCSADQPLNVIRDYFGEQFGYYFAWCGHNVRTFVGLSLLGAVIEVLKSFIFTDFNHGEILSCIWLAIMIIAGSYLTLGWARTEGWWAVYWDQLDKMFSAPQARADYRGNYVTNPLNSKGKKIRMYATWKLNLAKLFTYTLTLAFMLFTIGLVSLIYAYRPLAIETFGLKIGGKIISIGISVQILICNKIWRILTTLCVYLENPRSNEEYYQAFIWKQFVFQFVNAYQCFFYILFVQPFRNGCPGEAGIDAFELCVEYARSSLYTTFASYGFFAILGMAQPYIMQQWELRSEIKAIEKRLAEQGKSAKDLPHRSFMERQGKMMDYPQEDQVADMLELVIVAGYVLVFGVLAPAVTVIALCFFLLRLRVDGWKLCEVVKRPYPTASSGLGEWTNVIDTLSWVGLAASCATIALQARWPSGEPLHWMHKILCYFIVERVMMYIKLFCEAAIGTQTSATKLLLQRREYVSDRLMLGKAKDFPRAPPENAVYPARKELATQLTTSASEWPDVDHEDDKNDWGPVRQYFESLV